MSEISDLTNNPMAIAGIMFIIWNRSSDPGRNWRHVFKGLYYLIFQSSVKIV
ncbi:hypothetical protein KIN20_022128, partial [Parelaphostrongylus tenuis]